MDCMTLSKSLDLSGHPFPARRTALLVQFSYLRLFIFFPVPGIRFYKLRVRLITHESSENEHEMNLPPVYEHRSGIKIQAELGCGISRLHIVTLWDIPVLPYRQRVLFAVGFL